jgi:hypothetical protein
MGRHRGGRLCLGRGVCMLPLVLEGRHLSGRVPLLIGMDKDHNVIEGGRLLQRHVRAKGIAEAGYVELDLLVLSERWAMAGVP